MKKISILLSAFVVLLLSSCSSIPKKAKEGEGLLIGQVIINAYNYDYDLAFGNLNGIKKAGLEITVRDTTEQKDFSLTTDKDGYLITTSLVPNHTYYVKTVKATVYGGGGYSWMESNIYSVYFTVHENAVTNIGVYNCSFDGAKNQTWTNIINHSEMHGVLKKLAPESEWTTKKIYDECTSMN